MPFRSLLALLVILSACTVQSSVSSHYLTAEKLWTEKNYRAAVSEFDHVVKESPNTPIGLQALWRASMTRDLFLGESEEALKGFEAILERAGSSELAPQAQIQMGEIYFTKLARYPKAIEHYEKLLQAGKFSEEEQARFLHRIGRSRFLLGQIRSAIEVFEQAAKKHPTSAMTPKIKLDLANSWYALGDGDKSSYGKALRIYGEVAESTQNTNPRLYAEAVFGEAATLEELDELEKAHERFKSIANHYPAPNVVRIRMVRVSERMAKKRK